MDQTFSFLASDDMIRDTDILNSSSLLMSEEWWWADHLNGHKPSPGVNFYRRIEKICVNLGL